jgi:hypothetical protein
MIYTRPADSMAVDQGDIIDDCPLISVESLAAGDLERPNLVTDFSRVYVLTQTCDLAQGKVAKAVVAVVLDAAALIAEGHLKAADVRGPIRAARVFGWYFLPKSPALALSESIIDLRSLHTIPLPLLEDLCRAGKRVAHLEPLYREHLARHFADTYSRIGLPMPYETD